VHFDQRQARRDTADVPSALSERVYTVSELTREVRATLEDGFPAVWVVGEVSNVRRPASGHVYLTLKDDRAQIASVIWRSTAARILYDVRDGMQALAFGNITVYEPRGQYQMIIRRLEPKGIGALQLAFQQLKERLAAEGLFDPAHKKPLPAFPRTIGIVTSATGAAIRDILNVIDRRFPRVRVLLYPCRVQGEGAAEEIAAGIAALNRIQDIDVAIVGRGGGSLEDLWAFNEEVVARAIHASRIPIVSAVGHEIDFTIADFVADRRALTPTEAGELVVPELDRLLETLDETRVRLARALTTHVARARERLDGLARSYGLRRPLELVRQREQQLDDLAQRIVRALGEGLRARRQTTDALAGRLETLSPLHVLARGYSITVRPSNGHALRDAGEVNPGDLILTRLHKGTLRSKVMSAASDKADASGCGTAEKG